MNTKSTNQLISLVFTWVQCSLYRQRSWSTSKERMCAKTESLCLSSSVCSEETKKAIPVATDWFYEDSQISFIFSIQGCPVSILHVKKFLEFRIFNGDSSIYSFSWLLTQRFYLLPDKPPILSDRLKSPSPREFTIWKIKTYLEKP